METWIRSSLSTVILFFVSALNAAELAPPPRLVGPPTADDPAETVERIIRKAREVGDRLEKLDPGSDTRVTQGDILRDIESLIREQQNPPPSPPQTPPQPMPDPMSKNDKSEKPPGGSPPMPKNESPPKGSPPGLPSESQDPPKSNPPPARVQRNRPQPGGEKKPSPMPDPIAGQEKEPKTKPGGQAPSSTVASKVAPKMLLPLEGDVEKDVWGHLPEQLRKQVSQYYRQEFMPQYAELLRQYYASLAEREGKR